MTTAHPKPRLIQSIEAMEIYGGQIAKRMITDTVVYLNGDLGSGKTTLARGILRGKGHAGAVPSPTFTLMETYPFGDQVIVHIDLYRIEDPQELEQLAIRDYLQQPYILLIEWADKARSMLPAPDCEINIEIIDETTRRIEVTSFTRTGAQLCAA